MNSRKKVTLHGRPGLLLEKNSLKKEGFTAGYLEMLTRKSFGFFYDVSNLAVNFHVIIETKAIVLLTTLVPYLDAMNGLLFLNFFKFPLSRE